MIVCQDCGMTMKQPPINGRCPSCDSVYFRAETVGQTNDESDGAKSNLGAGDIDATLDAAAIESTLAGDNRSLDVEQKNGINKIVVDKTVEIGHTVEIENAGEIDQTLDSMQVQSTPGTGQPAFDQTIDGDSDASVSGSLGASVFRGNSIEKSATRVSRGRSSTNKDLNEESLNKWTLAAGDSVNPLLSLSAQQSFDYDEVPLTNRRRLCVDPNDLSADYEIVKAVGKGAMGEVFAAKQKSLNRTVALKTISGARSRNPKDQRKFLYEARITSELTHPNIVPVHDLAVGEDGDPFYSMKLVSGTPWQKVIRDKSLDENLDIFMKVCDAIGFAHSQNIIHRDLKPENIMLGAFGEVLVMDWGLAVDLTHERKFDLAGTPAYMSPEMARHDIDLIGTTSDIYLLGAILYQIVTGKAPHPGHSVTECVIAASFNKLIPPPDPDHPLLKIALVAIASEPDDRYATVSDLQDAIRDYRRHAESVAQSQRAETTLQKAIDGQDYESFARSMFGFSSALELWPENSKAIDGLDRARFAYGKSALDRSDFDLALQVLRPEVDAERQLVEAAKTGKLQAQQRIARIRRLTNTLAAGGGFAAIVFLGLSLWAIYEKGKATELADQQIVLRQQAEVSETAAKLSEGRALESEAKAREALEGERQAKADLAIKNVELNESNVQLDESARKLAASLAAQQQLTRKSQDAAEAEKLAKDEAVEAKLEAEREQKRAERARLVAELRNYPANLSLAANQIQQRDVGRTLDLLNEIAEVDRVFRTAENGPKTDNWAMGRIRLATNQDIPRYVYGDGKSRITSSAIAGQMGLIGLGGIDGSVELVKWNGTEFKLFDRLDAERCGGRAAVANLAIAPGGKWLAFSKHQLDGEMVYFWHPGKREVVSQLLPGLTVSDLHYVEKSGQLVACLQGSGVRIWDVTLDGTPSTAPRTPRVLGQYELVDFESTGVNGVTNAVSLISAGENRYLGKVSWDGEGDFRVLRSERAVGQQFVEIEKLDDDHVVIGELAGRLQIAKIFSDQVQVLAELRDDVHRTRITNLAASSDSQTLLSIGLEPVIQVWQRDELAAMSNFVPTLQLIGHQSDSILSVEFVKDSRSVVSVDEGGNVLYWDLMRQAQRQVIERQQPAASRYSGGLGNASVMRSVNGDGVIESWNAVDRTQFDNVSPYNYVGHTPGAVLQDFSVTPDGRFAVTSANIGSAISQYLQPDSKGDTREFCVWDFEGRTMLGRWTDNRRGFPCVAISPNGTAVAIGSNGEPLETVVIDLATQTETVLVDDQGRGVRADDLDFRKDQSGRLTTVAYGGMVAEFDPAADYKIVHYNRDFLDPPTSSSQIVGAAWSGTYFVVLFNSGHVRLFADTISVDGDNSKGPEGTLESVGNFGVERMRLQRGAVDWLVLNQERKENAVRNGIVGTELVIAAKQANGTGLISVTATADGKWVEKERKVVPGDCWLSHQGTGFETVQTAWIERDFDVQGVQHLVILDSGNICLTTNAGSVMRGGQDTKSNLSILGRSKCSTAGGDANAETLIIAGNEGQLWLASCREQLGDTENVVKWRGIQHSFSAIHRVKVSPDGRFWGGIGERRDGTQGFSCQSITRDKISELWLEAVVAFAWKPVDSLESNELSVLLDREGGIISRSYRLSDAGEWIIDREGPLKLDAGKLESAHHISDLVYFGERFADPSKPVRWYQSILMRQEDEGGSEVRLFACDEIGTENALEHASIRLPSQAITSIASSSVDGLLVVGDQEGGVMVWFLAPSVDRKAFELITIDRHRGQRVTSLAFSTGGHELITGDAGGRQYIWLAADPLGGISDR